MKSTVEIKQKNLLSPYIPIIIGVVIGEAIIFIGGNNFMGEYTVLRYF